jgi:cyanate permease
MSKIQEISSALLIWAGAAFVALLLWFVLVVNHQRDLERDKFYAQHCQTVESSAQLFGGTIFSCAKADK